MGLGLAAGDGSLGPADDVWNLGLAVDVGNLTDGCRNLVDGGRNLGLVGGGRDVARRLEAK